MTETSLRISPDNGVAAVKNRAMPGDADHNVAVYMATQTEAREEEAGGRLAEGASNTLNDLSNVEAVTISLPAPPEVSAAEAPLEAIAAPKIVTGMVPVAWLRPYSKNAEIYAQRDDVLFTKNIRENGVLTDLVVTEDGETLGGNRRLFEAVRLGLAEVPVKVVACKTEDAKLLRALDDNVQRVKTNQELAREYVERLGVEARAGAERKVRAAKRPRGRRTEVEKLTPLSEAGKARDKAAKALNLSGVTAEKGRKVLEAIATAQAQGDNDVADELLDKLNEKGFHSAFNRAQALGYSPKTVKATVTAEATHDATAREFENAPLHPTSAAAADEAELVARHDVDSDDEAVATYIGATAKLEEVLAEMLTLDQRRNLLQAHEDACDWFHCNAEALNENY